MRISTAVGAASMAVAVGFGPMWSARADHHENQQTEGQAREGDRSTRTIQMIAEDYAFKPSRIVVEPGQQVRVELKNSGKNQHNLEFELPEQEVKLDRNLQPGVEGVLRFRAPQSTGEYVFYCPVGDHRELGMEGRLVVSRSAGQQLSGRDPVEWRQAERYDSQLGIDSEPAYQTRGRYQREYRGESDHDESQRPARYGHSGTYNYQERYGQPERYTRDRYDQQQQQFGRYDRHGRDDQSGQYDRSDREQAHHGRQQYGRYDRDDQSGQYDRSDREQARRGHERYGRATTGQRTVRGEIVSVRPITFWDLDEQLVFTIAKLRLDDGRTVFIDLGPEGAMREYQIRPGDTLVARGQFERVNGQPVLLADQIRIGDQVARVDRQTGRYQQEGEQFNSSEQRSQREEREFRGGVQRFGERGTGAGATRQQLDRLISEWPEASRNAAREMLNEYGPPDGITESMLVWHDNGQWKRTIVHRDPVPHNFPMPHTDVLEQTIKMSVPPDKFDEIAQFDGSVIVDRTKGEVSARCDKEAANILALNLTHDIVKGERSVDEARQFYAKTIQQFKQGEKTDYVQKLQFEPGEQTQDPGEPVNQSGESESQQSND